MMQRIVRIKILKLMYKAHKFASISGCITYSATYSVPGAPAVQAASLSVRSQ